MDYWDQIKKANNVKYHRCVENSKNPRDIYFLDLENACLKYYLGFSQLIRQPLIRADNPIWANLIRENLDHATFDDYKSWVLAGGGDDWFQDNLHCENPWCEKMSRRFEIRNYLFCSPECGAKLCAGTIRHC